MKSFLFGTVLGVSVGTVGFGGLAPILDGGVRFIQTQTINAVQTRNENQTPPPAPNLNTYDNTIR